MSPYPFSLPYCFQAVLLMAVRSNLCALMLLLVFIAGCSESVERVPVKGKVLIDGQPLAHGTIQVAPEGARPAYGELNSDGEYSLMTYKENDGTVPGNHTATVTAIEIVDEWHNKWHAPKKYSTPNAGLTVEVRPDGTASDIELSWNGGKPFVESNRKD